MKFISVKIHCCCLSGYKVDCLSWESMGTDLPLEPPSTGYLSGIFWFFQVSFIFQLMVVINTCLSVSVSVPISCTGDS